MFQRENSSGMAKGFSKATMMLTGAGPPVHKQLKTAITEGNEDKAISIYMSKEGSKIHPSKPFPSKKTGGVQDTPMHLTAKYASAKLFKLLMEYGGHPGTCNARSETCAHSVCLMTSYPFKRAEIIDMVFDWRGQKADNSMDFVDIDTMDVDGNAVLHIAAHNGLLPVVERLVERDANLSLLNHQDLSSCEIAERAQQYDIATMLELAWLFRPTNELQEATQIYHKFASTPGKVVLDGESIKISELIEFINQAIKVTSEALDETAARAEILLNQYCWDVRKLRREYHQQKDKVLSSAKIKARARHGKSNDLKKGLINVGIPIEDVYLDPCYAQVQSFVVYQDGKKKVFNIQNVEGKTGVYPIDYDPSYRFVDQHQNISENSHIKPKKTDPCLLCGETMLEAASIQHYIAGTLVESSRREIQCSSGHKYCYTCWSDHIQSLLKHDTLTCLPCPAADCGEILDLQWAPVFLKRPELVNKLLAQRQKHIIDILNLTWCPVPDCGLLVHVNQTFGAGANGSNLKSPSGDDIQSYKGTQFNANAGASVPRMAICGHGHAFCLSCPREAHSPCACHDLSTWQELLRDESQHVDSKDPNSPGYLLLSYPTIKKCGHCDAMMGKSEGCNVITCEHCYAKQCWTCQQDWSTHTASVSTSGAPFYCNRFFAHNGRDNGGEDEEKDDHVSLASASTSSKRNAAPPGMTSHGQKNQKLNKTIHHYSRFMTHFESRNLEFMVKLATIERIYEGLKACQEGNLKWLPGTSSINPLAEHNWEEDSYSALRSLDGKDVVALEDFYEKPEEVLEFLEMAFDELAKCRILLQWTYPFALVELEINQGKAMLASNSAGSQRNKAPIGSILTPELRNEFDGLQSSLEYCTESLSNVVARRRIRGTKQEISVLTTTARVRRLDLEQWIVYYYSLKQTEPVIDYVSSNSSISSASRSQSRDKDNLDDLFAADGLDDQGKYSSSDEDEPKPPKVDPREAARLKHINSIEENDITAPIASKSNIQRKPSALSEIIHNMQFEDDTKKKMRKKIESLYVPKEDEEEEEEEAPPVKEAPRQKVRPVEPPQPPPQPQLTYEQRLIGAKKDPDQEALEHAILISKQEEEFGLNMYDALTPQDEHILHEYMVQGFTREEAILILFEERFGKVSIQSDHITPAMPTLHKVSSQFVTSPHAHLVTEADEPEIEHLMTKGFTREQAIEVMFYNRQRGVSSWDVPTSNRSSARNNNAPPPSMYNNMPPPPPAPVVNERASIELLVSQGYTLEQATSIVRNSSSQSSGLIYQDAPQGNSSMYQQSQQQMMPPVQDNDNDVNRLVSQGFTREQAIQIVETERSRQAPSSSSYYNNNSPSNHTQSYNTQSNNSRNNNAQSNAFNLDHEVNHLMALGYTREQATQVAMASNPGATSSGNTNQSIYRASGMVNNSYDYQDEYYQAPAPATSLYSRSYDTMNTMTNTIANQRQSTNYNNNSNAEFEMERAMIVTQQEREYGTNMYDSKTPADEPEIHSLMGQGYSYDEALLLIFERRYKPQAMNGYPGGSVYSSGYNLPPQGDLSVPSYAGNAIIYGANTGNPVPYDAYNNAAPYGYAGNNQYNSYSQPQGYMDYNNDPNQPSYPPPPGAALTNSKQQERRKTLKSKKSSAAVMSPRSDMEEVDRPKSIGAASAGGAGVPKRKVFRGASLLGLAKDNDNGGDNEDPLARAIRLSQEEATKRNSTTFQQQNFQPSSNPLTRRSSFVAGKDNNPPPASTASKLKYKDADVKQLMKMGFNKDQAVQALLENNNDVRLAAEALSH